MQNNPWQQPPYQQPPQSYPPYPPQPQWGYQPPQQPQKKFPVWLLVSLIVAAALLCNVVAFLIVLHP